MLNFLIFPLHAPELLYGVWWDYSTVRGVCRVWPWFWTCPSITVRPTVHLHCLSGSLSGMAPLADPHSRRGAKNSLSPPKWSGRWRTDSVTTWSVWSLGTTLYSFHGAACCHPCLRCMFSPLFLEELSVGYLTVNWAGLCLFPASPDHINKRLVPNSGIKWDGVFHHQRALELHLRLLFVSVETTWTMGCARSWKWAATCIYLKPWACPQKLAQKKDCDRKGWDLQLQRPAVPCFCPGSVHGAPVSTEQAGLVGMVSLSTDQHQYWKSKTGWGEVCHGQKCQGFTATNTTESSGVPAHPYSQLRHAQGWCPPWPLEKHSLPGTVSNLRLCNLLLQNQKIPK